MKYINSHFLNRKYFIYIILLHCTGIFAQVSEGGLPFSFKVSTLKKGIEMPEYILQKLETKKLIMEDSLNGVENRYSKFTQVDIDIKKGLKTALVGENGQIWQQKIVSENAKSIQLVFSKFYLPEGAKLFLYSMDHSLIYGAYTNKNNRSDSTFIISDFTANQLIVEYFEPYNASFPGKVEIGSVGQAYRAVPDGETQSFININCYEGRNWQTEKHAVCKITFMVGTDGYVCSGSLINNLNNDKLPYFLTANHCIDNIEIAKTVVAYFNYERAGCYDDIKEYKTISGASLLSKGTDSDYSLLLLDNKPDSTYLPFYAGWDITDTSVTKSVVIHHPRGSTKKISFDKKGLSTYPDTINWESGEKSIPGTHWRMEEQIGDIMNGSSGGPLFSGTSKKIIGQLHGGSSSHKYFGKLSYSFNHPDSGFVALKEFLDPDNTGIQYVEGVAPLNNPPDVQFTCDFVRVCTNADIQFFDNSAFIVNSRKWKFSPSAITYRNGTDSTSKNPVVRFNEDGIYSVSLTATNNSGENELTMTNFILAGDQISLGIFQPYSNSVCFYDFDSVIFETMGAKSYQWQFDATAENYFNRYQLSDNMQVLKLKHNVSIDSTIRFNTMIIGKHGSCTDTVNYPVRIVKTFNDDLEYALPLVLGENGPFANYCATIQSNEPSPPPASCTGQNSWCDEFNNGHSILKNSVWFYFYGPSSGTARIKSDGFGFDNQIAVYEANSPEEIMDGKATILAANDDYSETNSNPQIVGINVVPEQKYWIQVDGSGGGTYGQFYLYLFDNDLTGIESNKVSGELKIYPSPATDYIFVSADDLLSGSLVRVKIYSIDGKLLFDDYYNTTHEKSLQVNTSSLIPGVYFIRADFKDNVLAGKFMK